jgi:hypothetical protein
MEEELNNHIMNLNTFLADQRLRNAWIKEPHLSVYVRKSRRSLTTYIVMDCLDIASIEVSVRHRNKGYFSHFLVVFEQAARDTNRAVYVENVISPILPTFLTGLGYKQTPTSTSDCPCMYLIP